MRMPCAIMILFFYCGYHRLVCSGPDRPLRIGQIKCQHNQIGFNACHHPSILVVLCAEFRPVAPTVAVGVEVRVVDVGIRLRRVVVGFPPRFHEVVVCNHFAVVGVLIDALVRDNREVGLQEVVHNSGDVAVGVRRMCVRRVEEVHSLVRRREVQERNGLLLRDGVVAETDKVFPEV